MEKRVEGRTKRRLMVRYGLNEVSKTGFTRNLSDSGMFIQTTQIFKPGTTIQIEVVFPSGKFAIWGRVVRARRVPAQLTSIMASGMGIKFIDSGDEWREKFTAWKAGKG
jgi:Tfp pilus assembly protein PilZ